MKILLFTSASPFSEFTGAMAGGAENALRSVAYNLAKLGHDVHYVTCGKISVEVRVEKFQGMTLHILPNKFRLKQRPDSFKRIGFNLLNKAVLVHDKLGLPKGSQVRRRTCLLAESLRYSKVNHSSLVYMERLQEKKNFDIIHCYSSAPDIHIARILKDKFSVPYVVRMGGRFYYKYFKRSQGNKLVNYLKMMEESFDKADFFAFNSESLYENSKAYFSEMEIEFPKDRSNVLDIGVDVEEIIEELKCISNMEEPQENKFKISCIGKFKAGSKRQDLLLGVLKKIKDGESSLNINDVHIDFVGGGDLLNDHIKMAKNYGVDEYCTFHGPVPKKKVYEFLKKSNYFILPTDFEGSSKALAEALLAETPVLASNIPPNEELIDPSGGGLLFENSVEGLLQQLEYASTNNDEMLDRAKRGRAFVFENLNPVSQVKKYEELFGQVTSQNRTH